MKKAYLSAVASICLSFLAVAAASAKAAEKEGTKEGTKERTAVKAGASLADKPVGAKTTDELIRKLAQAYDAHDTAAYLKIIQAPIRDRMRMEIQFVRDGSNVVRNFRYLTLAQEIARMGVASGAASMGKDKIVAGVKSTYTLPVVGYIDFDVKSAPDAKPLVVGVPVGQSEGKYFLVTRVTAPSQP